MPDPVTILHGNCLEVLETLPAESVHCCVTSPPFLWLRDYGLESFGWPAVTYQPITGLPAVTIPEQSAVLGLEADPLAYVGHLVAVFRAVRRVLRADGTCWVEMGDGYANCGGTGRQGKHGARCDRRHTQVSLQHDRKAHGLKPKDLIGAPWRLALALQADGWFLRQEVVWYKRNPMPESTQDRPTRTHSTILLLSRSERYRYDAGAIAEPCGQDTHARYARGRSEAHKWADGGPGGQTIARTFEHMAGAGLNPKARAAGQGTLRSRQNESFTTAITGPGPALRNSRSVWPISIQGYRGAHFATFTAEVPRRCILAGCPLGGTVLDPFGGSGTTGMVALELGRRAVLVEAKAEYCRQAVERLRLVQPGLGLDGAGGAGAGKTDGTDGMQRTGQARGTGE